MGAREATMRYHALCFLLCGALVGAWQHQLNHVSSQRLSIFRPHSGSRHVCRHQKFSQICASNSIDDELGVGETLDSRLQGALENIQQSIQPISNVVDNLLPLNGETVSSTEERREVTDKEEQVRDREDAVFLFLGTAPALLAFFLWEDISHSLAVFLDRYGAIGRAVDGGQFTASLLRPTITGVVVPVISIALATLVSTTVNVLRERQVELRALINKEACELRLLRRAVFGMFGTRQHASRRAKALALLYGYAEQLERECSVGAVEALQDLQLSGGIAVNELDEIAEMLHGVDGAAASRQGSVGVADSLILSLNGHRSNRVALILSVFPVIHWGVLVALSASICFTFLLNSNQQVLQYLNSIQLRSLFAILVGVFSGTATLCINLADPFRGSFSISESATQMGDLKVCLQQDVLEATKEEGEISSRVVHALLLGGTYKGNSYKSYNTVEDQNEHAIIGSDSLMPSGVTLSQELSKELAEGNGGSQSRVIPSERRKNGDRRRYGLFSTIYFHILTGPLGSNARVLGDVLAWVAAFVGNSTRSISRRVAALSSAIRTKLKYRSKPKDLSEET